MFERFIKIADPAKKLTKISITSFRFLISGETSSHAASNPVV